MKKIRKIIEKHFRLKLDEPTRRHEVVFARGCYYKIVREMLGLPYSKIAKSLNKNHATAMHGIKMVNNLTETDKQLKHDFDSLLNKFSHYNKLKEKMTATQLVRAYNDLLFAVEKKDLELKIKDGKIAELNELIYILSELE